MKTFFVSVFLAAQALATDLPKCGFQAGDANHDGEFDSSDMIQIMETGKYETPRFSTWAEGDFNHDGLFDSSDLTEAMSTGQYEKGKYCTPDFRIFASIGDATHLENVDRSHLIATSWHIFKYEDGAYDYSAPNVDILKRTAQTWDVSKLMTVNVEIYEGEDFKRHMHTIFDTLKAENPAIRRGVYRYLPQRDYWTPIHYWSNVEAKLAGLPTYKEQYFADQYALWRAHNEQFTKPDAYSSVPLASKVDVVYPSCYTFHRDEVNYPGDQIVNDPNVHNWEIFCAAQIAEARKYGKPVIVYLWPIYHPGGTFKTERRLVEAYYFKKQLELVKTLADGAVIWEGGLIDDDYTQSWYQALQDFLQGHSLTRTAR